MTISIQEALASSAWEDLADWFPPDLERLALDSGGFQRRRAIRTPLDFLRVALAYGVLDLSLRSVSAWASEQGLGELSDVAVLGRLRRGWTFLAAVLQRLLARVVLVPPHTPLRRRIVLVDATTLSAPGSGGTDWRLHVGYDASRSAVVSVELTDGHGGEHLGRFGLGKGDLCVGDRGYAHEKRIAGALAAGADILVRIGHRAVRLIDTDGKPLDVLAFATRKRARAGRPPRCESVQVFLQCDVERRWPLRVVAVRKSADAAENERKRVKKEAGRKGKAVTQRTLDSSGFTFLLHSVPLEEADDATIADLYRVRWQIELAFKRWKSLLGLGNLRADDPALARAYIYAKLIAAVLSDLLVSQRRAFSPYGVPVRGRPLEDLALGE